jgi:hypothetical protein
MSKITSNKPNQDKYNTQSLNIIEKTEFYENKISDLKNIKQVHRTEVANIKAIRTSSQNVLQFKLDETTKKMRNEINRLREEARRHEDSQKNENLKIKNQIKYLKENCQGLSAALKEILDKVVKLEKSLGV